MSSALTTMRPKDALWQNACSLWLINYYWPGLDYFETEGNLYENRAILKKGKNKMYLLGMNLETAGTGPSASDIIEIGYIIWYADLSCPVKCDSCLIKMQSRHKTRSKLKNTLFLNLFCTQQG